MQIITPGVKPQTSTSLDIERIKLCDVDAVDPTIVNAEFYRHLVYAADGTSVSSTFDTDLAGAAYTLVGVAAECPEVVTAEYDLETCIMCDNLNDGTKPTEIKVVTKYNKADGSIDSTEYYTLDGTAYAVARTIERCPDKKPVEVITGTESVNVEEDIDAGLVVPANTQYAIIQNLSGVAIFFSKDGSIIGSNDGSEGFRLDDCGTIKLGCDPQSGGSIDELANFSVIGAVGTSGRLQVCYFGCN